MLPTFQGGGTNLVMHLLADLRGIIEKSFWHPKIVLTVKQASSGTPAMSEQV